MAVLDGLILIPILIHCFLQGKSSVNYATEEDLKISSDYYDNVIQMALAADAIGR